MAMGNMKMTMFFPDRELVRYLGEVTSTVSIDGREIEEKGLFSIDTFGALGTEERFERFGYIDLHIDVLHPRIYKTIKELSSFYLGILTGKTYAVFDSKTKDFLPSIPEDGKTGYTFFLKHIYEIKIPKRETKNAENMRKAFNKYQKQGLLTNNKLMVLPAGMRDINIEDDGRTTEDELNEFYRRIISSAAMVEGIRKVFKTIDYLAIDMQIKIDNLYDEIFKLLKGKKGYIGANVSTRNIDYTTANVITGKSIIVDDLGKEQPDLINYSTMGIFQFVKSAEPIVKHMLNTTFLDKIFDKNIGNAYLFNPKIKRVQNVNIEDNEMERWTSSNGLTNLFNRCIDNEVKNAEIEVGDYLLLAVYDTKNEYTIYQDDSKIPDEHRAKLRGITYGELLYLASYKKAKELIASTVRYPITSQLSTYITYINLVGTTTTRPCNVVLSSEEGETSDIIKDFIIPNTTFDDSFSVSYTRIRGAGADFDGDSFRTTILFTKESILEAKQYINSLGNLLTAGGKLAIEISDFITTSVTKTLSRRIKK